MSELGKIFELDYNSGRKVIYPVVYENNSYYYCKVYGSDDLRTFGKYGIISFKEYEEHKIEFCEEKRYIHVYMTNKECKDGYNFPEIKFSTIDWKIVDFNKRIRNLQSSIGNRNRQINECQADIDRFNKSIADYEAKIEDLMKLKLEGKEEIYG